MQTVHPSPSHGITAEPHPPSERSLLTRLQTRDPRIGAEVAWQGRAWRSRGPTCGKNRRQGVRPPRHNALYGEQLARGRRDPGGDPIAMRPSGDPGPDRRVPAPR